MLFQVEKLQTPLQLSLLTMVNNTASPVYLSPASTAIMVKDEIFMHNLAGVTDAFALLLKLIYSMHVDIPEKIINTFTFAQNELVGVNDDKPPKSFLLSLTIYLNDIWVKLRVTCMCIHEYMFNLSHRVLGKSCFKSCINA